jgi:glycerophosphoryl diester phosphodiesterase
MPIPPRANPRASGPHDPRREPLVIAHRGASWEEPENTLRAFRRAIELGADHVELDVRATRDGVLIAAHHPVRIPFGELRERSPDVPTLAEALEECVGKIGIVVDIKRHDVTERTLALLREFGADEDPTMVASFSPHAIASTRRVRPALRTIQHLGRVSMRAAADHAWGVGFIDRQATTHVIRGARKLGLASTVYTVNDPVRMNALIDIGVTGIFTDRPDLLRWAIRGSRSESDGEPRSPVDPDA